MSPELSIIVPVYNEAATLRTIMTALMQTCSDAQIIYVDDGSKDDSLKILHAMVRPTDCVIAKENGGKGSAIIAGLEKATGQYTVIQDADLEYDPREIQSLLDAAKTHPNTAIFGSRFFQGKTPHIYWRFLIGNKVITGWLNLLFDCKLTDSYTCYKLLPTKIFKQLNLKSKGFELEAEIASRCLKTGIKVMEVPISYRPRSIEQGKKINGMDAIKGAFMMLKVRYE
jgi:glycosyltransferase involved in cell wall biosynthesis